MAKVAEYQGNVSVSTQDDLMVVGMHFMQGEIRTSLTVALSPEEFVKALKGQRVDVTVFEDAVQTRKKPKQGSLEE